MENVLWHFILIREKPFFSPSLFNKALSITKVLWHLIHILEKYSLILAYLTAPFQTAEMTTYIAWNKEGDDHAWWKEVLLAYFNVISLHL
jgi:hypothetical protein